MGDYQSHNYPDRFEDRIFPSPLLLLTDTLAFCRLIDRDEEETDLREESSPDSYQLMKCLCRAGLFFQWFWALMVILATGEWRAGLALLQW